MDRGSGADAPLPPVLSNTTREALNLAIDRLEAELEQARNMPQWGIILVCVIAAMALIIMAQLIACVAIAPVLCAWDQWNKRSCSAQGLLRSDFDVESEPEPEPEVEAAAAESASQPRMSQKARGKQRVNRAEPSARNSHHHDDHEVDRL